MGFGGFGPAQGVFGGDATFTNLTVTGTANLYGSMLVSGSRFLQTSYPAGGDNLFFGKLAGNANAASAGPNIGIGSSALFALSSGTFNAAFGDHALAAVTTGGFNTVCGHHGLATITDASYNTAIGEGAIEYLTTGNYNTAVGQYAMVNSTSGHDNTALGAIALGNGGSTGNENVAVGSGSMYVATSGSQNTMVGTNAGQYITTGGNNVSLGYNSGPSNGNGGVTGTIAIGNGVVVSSSSTMNIGNVIYGDLATGAIGISGPTGAKTQIKQATTLLSAVSGASVTATSLIPAKAKVFGVVTRVTTGLGTGNGTTGYAVGTAGDPNLWGDVVGTIAGTDTDNSDATVDPAIAWSASAQDVVITAAGGNFDGTGAIRVIVLYWDTVAPTS